MKNKNKFKRSGKKGKYGGITQNQARLARELDSKLHKYLFQYCPGNDKCNTCPFEAFNKEGEDICMIEEAGWEMECINDEYRRCKDERN